MHEDFLRYRRARFLWIASAFVVASIALYLTQSADDPPNGGTWQGYVLGSVGALLILWLALLGIRKRRYRSPLGSVQGWTSAHIYLGSALLVIGTLHTAGQLGWNVHTLSYILMCIVILSGFFGVFAYRSFPRSMRGNLRGSSREDLFAELNELNERSRSLSRKCVSDIQAVVQSAIERTAIGGRSFAQLVGSDHSTFVGPASPGDRSATAQIVHNPDQNRVIEFIAAAIPRAEKGTEAESLQSLLSALCRRQSVLRRIRSDIRLRAWLQVWLFVHIPFTIALIGALIVHISTVFIYW